MRTRLRAASGEKDLATMIQIHARAFSKQINAGDALDLGIRGCLTLAGVQSSVLEDETTNIMQGFVAAGPRPYSEMVQVWDMLAQRVQGGWPLLPPSIGYISELAVDPACQKSGLGSLLLCIALDQLRARGLRAVLVFTGEHLQSAVALYTRFGFRRFLKQQCEQGGTWWWWVLDNDGSHHHRTRYQVVDSIPGHICDKTQPQQKLTASPADGEQTVPSQDGDMGRRHVPALHRSRSPENAVVRIEGVSTTMGGQASMPMARCISHGEGGGDSYRLNNGCSLEVTSGFQRAPSAVQTRHIYNDTCVLGASVAPLQRSYAAPLMQVQDVCHRSPLCQHRAEKEISQPLKPRAEQNVSCTPYQQSRVEVNQKIPQQPSFTPLFTRRPPDTKSPVVPRSSLGAPGYALQGRSWMPPMSVQARENVPPGIM